MQEIWKNIPEYEGLYQVSNFGRIRSLKREIKRKKMGNFEKEEHLMKLVEYKGYLNIILSKNGVAKRYRVHRLVAKTFIPNPNNYKEVNHIDENKQNNRVDNLEWCNHLYNMNYGTLLERRINNTDYSYCHKAVNQYDLDGNFIKKWNNMSEPEKEIGILRQSISKCCRKKQKTAGGYKWEYSKI